MIPIGHIQSDFAQRYETPHQGVLASQSRGVITLVAGQNYEQALHGIEGFERIWLIYGFHLNPTATHRPMIQPPRQAHKVGVFATRSPHRPNGLGLTCVTLERVEGRRVSVRGVDLLDGSPIYDIKPYLPYCDAFPEATTGWSTPPRPYVVTLTSAASDAAAAIAASHDARLDRYAAVQLQLEPLNFGRKRLTPDAQGGVLSYRQWQIFYRIDEDNRRVEVFDILSSEGPHDVEG